MGYIGHRDTGCNGVQEVWGIWAMRPTGGMGYRGIRGTWAIGAQGVWCTRGMGHIGNRSYGQWGTWAMGLWAMGPMGNGAHGPMGDLDIFAHSIIITGWILTKILLDIDIDVFYLNTGRFFHDGLN